MFSQSVIKKALEEKPWISCFAPGRARVVPRTLKDKRAHREHGKYELEYEFDEEGLPEILSCEEERTGERCPGFYFTGQCYHSAALAKRLIERQERIAA